MTSRSVRLLVATAVLVAGCGLSACAQEAETVPDDVAGASGKGTNQTDEETKGNEESDSWTGAAPDEAFEKDAELPDSFPAAEFVIPAGAVVDDAGARSDTAWFVVLRATGQDEADAIWQQVIDGSGFTVSDETETGDGGRSATLTGTGLDAIALTLPQENGEVLLSYDLTVPE